MMENILYFYVIQFCFTGLVKNYVVNLKNKLWLLCTVYFHAIDSFQWQLTKTLKAKLSCVSFIPFFVFGSWSLLAMRLRKYFVIFVYILQAKMGKKEKTERKSRN